MTHADAALARALAEETGALLLALRDDPALRGRVDALRAAGDRAAHEHLLARLGAERPDDWVLSEEAPDEAGRLDADRVWIVDPLDGTREYGEGRADWAVHVALWERGELAAGAVALPCRGLVLGSDEVPAARRSVPGGPLRMAVSRTRPGSLAPAVAAALGAELVPMGSAGAKAMAVVLGEADLYLHTGGQHEWDNAAPVVVARAHGLHASRVDGSPLRYNAADLVVPDLLICRPELAEEALRAVSDVDAG